MQEKWNLPTDCPIEPKWFYQSEEEKIKFAWFLYEYACSYYNHITDSGKKSVTRWVKEQSAPQMADFCAYFSKRVQESLGDFILGRTSDILCDVGYIQVYWHRNSRQLNTELAFLAQQAMVGLLEICNTCPQQCLDNPSDYCMFFDRHS
jgi:hypothetical protein